MHIPEHIKIMATFKNDIEMKGTRLSSELSHTQYYIPDRLAQLQQHWASISKALGSIPIVVRHSHCGQESVLNQAPFK